MAVPKFYEFFKPTLRFWDKKEPVKMKNLYPALAAKMHLSDEDMQQMLPSRKKYTCVDRINWFCAIPEECRFDRAGVSQPKGKRLWHRMPRLIWHT